MTPLLIAAAACMPHAAMAEALATQYGEAVVAQAIDAQGRLVEFWAAPNGMSWTLVMRPPRGLSCIVGSGRYWMPVEQGEPS